MRSEAASAWSGLAADTVYSAIVLRLSTGSSGVPGAPGDGAL